MVINHNIKHFREEDTHSDILMSPFFLAAETTGLNLFLVTGDWWRQRK